MQLLVFVFVLGITSRKLSCKLSLLNSHFHSCNSCSRLTWHDSGENSHANSLFSTLIPIHATLVLVWPRMSVEKTLMQTLFSTVINRHLHLPIKSGLLIIIYVCSGAPWVCPEACAFSVWINLESNEHHQQQYIFTCMSSYLHKRFTIICLLSLISTDAIVMRWFVVSKKKY